MKKEVLIKFVAMISILKLVFLANFFMNTVAYAQDQEEGSDGIFNPAGWYPDDTHYRNGNQWSLYPRYFREGAAAICDAWQIEAATMTLS